MKKLQSFIGLFLILALFAGSPICAVAGENKFDLLRVVGLSYDFDDNESVLTRIDLAKTAIELSNLAMSSTGEAIYADIPQKHKLFGIVNTVSVAGYMDGLSDGLFHPYDEATPADASRVLLRMLGYDDMADKAGWNIGQYSAKAQGLGLYRGLSNLQKLTWYSFGGMILNMLEAPVLSVTSISGEHTNYRENADENYLKMHYGYISREGLVQAVGRASLSGYPAVSDGFVLVDGNLYQTGNVNMKQYLGKTVKFVLNGENQNACVIYANLTNHAEELSVDAEDVIDFNNYKLTYFDGNRQKQISIDAGTKIVVNGQSSGYDERLFHPLAGTLRFSDTDGDGAYELVNITSVVYIKNGGYNGTRLQDMFTGKSISLTKSALYFEQDGVTVTSDVLEKEGVAALLPGRLQFITVSDEELPFADSENAEVMTFDLTVPDKVKGMVKMCSNDGLQLSDTYYPYSKYFKALLRAGVYNAPALGSEGTVYLDANGKIFYADLQSTRFTGAQRSVRYGYLLGVAGNNNMFSNMKIRLIDEQATEQVLNLCEGFRLNGKKVTSMAALETSSTDFERLYVDGILKKQLIGYELDQEGMVKAFYTAKDYARPFITDQHNNETSVPNPNYAAAGYLGYDENTFSLDFCKVSADHRSGFEHLYSISESETVVFNVPLDQDNGKKYRVNLGGKTLPYGSYNVKLYNVSEKYEIGAVVVENKAAGGGTRDLTYDYFGTSIPYSTVITRKSVIYDADEEDYRTKFTGSYTTTLSTIATQVELTANDEELTDTDSKYMRRYAVKVYDNVQWKDLEPGDIIQCQFDADGRVERFRVIFRYKDLYRSDGGIKTQILNDETGSGEGSIQCYVGRIVRTFSDGRILFSVGADDRFTNLKLGHHYKDTPGAYGVTLYDTQKMTAQGISSGELMVGDAIVTRSWQGNVMEVIVYR